MLMVFFESNLGMFFRLQSSSREDPKTVVLLAKYRSVGLRAGTVTLGSRAVGSQLLCCHVGGVVPFVGTETIWCKKYKSGFRAAVVFTSLQLRNTGFAPYRRKQPADLNRLCDNCPASRPELELSAAKLKLIPARVQLCTCVSQVSCPRSFSTRSFKNRCPKTVWTYLHTVM